MPLRDPLLKGSTVTDLPTQLAYPLRAVLRTVVQAIIGMLLSWLARKGITVSDAGFETALVDLVVSAVWVAGTAFAAWVMTRPLVAGWLAGTPLAPAPYAPERAADADA